MRAGWASRRRADRNNSRRYRLTFVARALDGYIRSTPSATAMFGTSRGRALWRTWQKVNLKRLTSCCDEILLVHTRSVVGTNQPKVREQRAKKVGAGLYPDGTSRDQSHPSAKARDIAVLLHP